MADLGESFIKKDYPDFSCIHACQTNFTMLGKCCLMVCWTVGYAVFCREEISEHQVKWKAQHTFVCKMVASANTGVLEACVCRVSVRKVGSPITRYMYFLFVGPMNNQQWKSGCRSWREASPFRSWASPTSTWLSLLEEAVNSGATCWRDMTLRSARTTLCSRSTYTWPCCLETHASRRRCFPLIIAHSSLMSLLHAWFDNIAGPDPARPS